jgi:ATP-dependent Clp protease ATP-binding subunit ClpC
VIVLAQDEAARLKHNAIGTEHLLLGLLREEEGIAARVPASFDVTAGEVREQVARVVGEGDEAATGQAGGDGGGGHRLPARAARRLADLGLGGRH